MARWRISKTGAEGESGKLRISQAKGQRYCLKHIEKLVFEKKMPKGYWTVRQQFERKLQQVLRKKEGCRKAKKAVCG